MTLAGFAATFALGQSYIVFGGLAIAAYVLGLRHGFDADHIAAIDNTTRKLLQEGKRPLAVGTWFSLGHSTVVLALVLALTLATKAVAGNIPLLRSAGGLVGTTVSGVFLFIIGLVNLVIVIEIYGIFCRLRDGTLDEPGLEESLNKRGFMNRYFGKAFGAVSSPWKIYPIGVLFGLGFDTASEVALIALAVGAGSASGVSVWMILVLPLMFAAGMVLVDTTDGISMRLAYGWAFLKPIRKIYYNLTVTIISVLVAFLVGGIELLQVVSRQVGLDGAYWVWLDSLDFGTIGLWIVATFVMTWIVSMAYYEHKGYDKGVDPVVLRSRPS
ncbi:MAG TPA: HoxN/HupN/NixA family nickel/cobalt transporter [Nitrososphaerales archaeon]|nr:HoxN/HupN/NixA family nickel/cobalt transporter [Nitrososphaerales archaeon]